MIASCLRLGTSQVYRPVLLCLAQSKVLSLIPQWRLNLQASSLPSEGGSRPVVSHSRPDLFIKSLPSHSGDQTRTTYILDKHSTSER